MPANNTMPEKNLNGFAKLIGLLEFRFAFDVTHIHIASGQNMAKVFPMQVFHQVIIIEDGIIKVVTFSRHQKSGRFPVPAQQIFTAFFQGKQTIKGGTQLPAHGPVIQRACKNNYIAIPNCRINPVHIILLDTGALPVTVSAKASFASVNIHFIQKELRYGMACTFCPFSKRCYQSRGITAFTGTSI